MAKIPGGITSKPSGKLGNIIFGAARTPQGKVATAREAVDPSNPDTAAQQQQRGKFQTAVRIVQDIGPDIYQGDWNRSVGQLPGFQSWQSILLNNLLAGNTLNLPPDRPLGELHFPDTWTQNTGTDPESIEVDWSTEDGPNGSTLDRPVIIAIEKDEPQNGVRDVATVVPGASRGDGVANIYVDKGGTDYVTCLYFRGGNGNAGKISTARFKVFTSQSS